MKSTRVYSILIIFTLIMSWFVFANLYASLAGEIKQLILQVRLLREDMEVLRQRTSQILPLLEKIVLEGVTIYKGDIGE